ncbi:sporulation protein YqfD [Desulfovirgula thermocuniculi]|uniref:sporulation protein YqfD n=1 Tax=Desulfovirgula thermocuniculi TaxID=348842 RepID=UPI000415C1D7|nr:sporulation protein YqfD [Desulfovirgula thermocuniculi]
MFLFRLANFLVGYVTLALRGEAPEKLINMATARGIFLWDIYRTGSQEVRVKVRLSAVWPFLHLARLARCRFHVVGRAGLPFLWLRLVRRKGLLLGGVLFVTGLYILGSFVWSVDVTGNRRLAAQEVLEAAREAGLRQGVPRWSLDAAAVERALLERLPDLSWAGVYVRGTRVTVEVVEKVLPGERRQVFAHVVAKKSGLVKEVLVQSGHPLVKEGDTVVPGQILISGIIPPSREEESAGSPSPRHPTCVRAAGMVRARVWYEGYGEALLKESGQRPTGRRAVRACIKVGEREIILAGPRDVPFALYEASTTVKSLPGWRNLYLPVELVICSFNEMESYTVTRSRSEARQLAGERALEAAYRQVPKGAAVVHKQLDELVVKEPETVVRVKALVECVEEIGVEQPFDPGHSQ